MASRSSLLYVSTYKIKSINRKNATMNSSTAINAEIKLFIRCPFLRAWSSLPDLYITCQHDAPFTKNDKPHTSAKASLSATLLTRNLISQSVKLIYSCLVLLTDQDEQPFTLSLERAEFWPMTTISEPELRNLSHCMGFLGKTIFTYVS